MNLFIKTIERKLGKGFGVVWRQEWALRKTGEFKGHFRPHYHLLIIGCNYLDKELVRDSWRKAIKFNGGPLATDVRRIIGTDGAIRYVAKYISKNPSLDIGTKLDKGWIMGRFWGVRRPGLIPMCPVEIIEITNPLLVFESIIKASMVLNREPWKLAGGFSLLGDAGIKIFEDCKNSY
jgi:hypothetical protein